MSYRGEPAIQQMADSERCEPSAEFPLGWRPKVWADDENPKDKVGKAKPSMHFVPMIARLQEAIVMALGAKKYGAYNWREKKVLASVYSDAIDRHMAQWMDGEDLDEESGVSHLAHVRACCAILIDAIATGNLLDDRPKTAGVIAAFFRSRQP